MSLLLNALKKAEEGSSEKSAEQSAQSAASSPQSAVAPPPQQPGAAPQAAAPQASAVAGVNIKSEAEKPSPASVDFDAIMEKSGGAAGTEKTATAQEDKKGHERVDAARVFGASEEEDVGGDSPSIVRRLIITIVVLAGLGGGGYAAVFGGFLPGVDILGLLGFQSEVVVVSQPARQSVEDQLVTSEEISLLPVPAVDVQAGIDFADLSFLGNRPANFDREEYRQRIAVLTGYDINREIERRREEEARLIEEINLQNNRNAALEIDESVVGVDELEESVLPELQTETAAASRLAKLELDAKTASDSNLNISISRRASASAGGVGDAEVAQQVVAPAPVRVAQIDVQHSLDGQERKRFLQRAQQNYYAGKYSDAEAIYREIIRSSPTNRNALRGLAMVAVATGRYQLAAATYLDLLNFYPNDPVAISELTNLHGANNQNFYEVEKILKELLGKTPNVDDRVYFSLGNLYAGAERFGDAQKAYFEAFARNANNPDYAYNLAVTLDYLNKPNLAARYYKQALSLSEGASVFGFNASEVNARIEQLQIK